MSELEDKYTKFERGTNIDLLEEIATGGSGGPGATDHGSLTGLSDDDHTQYLTNGRGDARYYTKSQVDSALSGKQNAGNYSTVGHTHDDRYYTESEVTSLLAGKANATHTHSQTDVTGLGTALNDIRSDVTALENADASLDGRIDVLEPHVTSISYNANTAVNAALGSHFRITLTGNTTLGKPTNLVDGQKLLFEFVNQNGGAKTVTPHSDYKFNADITAFTLSEASGAIDYYGCVYNSSTGKLNVIAQAQGY